MPAVKKTPTPEAILAARRRDLDRMIESTGATNEQVAEYLGVSSRTVSRYRTGATPIPPSMALVVTDRRFWRAWLRKRHTKVAKGAKP